MSVLSLKNVTLVTDGKKLLYNINITFQDSQIHAIIGPNGAGKSTLAFTIMGLDDYRNINGNIILNDKDITKMKVDERARNGITLAWQEPARFEGLTVKEFLLASAKEKSLDSINEILIKVGLSPLSYLKRAVDKTLSGGERKKIEVASILAMDPEIVILDEPDSGIDIESLEKIFDIIKILKEQGKTVILITHSAEVLKHSDYAYLMCNGEIIDKGEMKKILPYFENNCIPCGHKNIPDKELLNE